MEYSFSEIFVQIGDEKILASKSDISGLSFVERMYRDISPSSRTREYLDKLRSSGALESFVSKQKLTLTERRMFANILKVPDQEIFSFHSHLIRRISTEDDLFSSPNIAINKALSGAEFSRVLYLPTYRRIEKDIKDIFPQFEDAYRRFSGETGGIGPGRSGNHYVELVSFGMEDVRRNLEKSTQELRRYSLSQFNDMSAAYLRDVIRGASEKFVTRKIKSLTDQSVSSMLDRVSESALSKDDKDLLRTQIKEIQRKRKVDLDIHERYLANYFTKLMTITEDIREKEKDIRSFVQVCNSYLSPSKSIVYDESKFDVSVVNENGATIDLSVLSSGEKQVISIFSHLYLDDTNNQIVVIDEPELSLSVPWQRKFLPDIVNTGRSGFLLAVTHSPFIYQNSLRPAAVDLKRLSSKGE